MKQLLLADDDGHIREVVRFALQQAGYGVMEARDGGEALALFAKHHFDLVLLDIIMPEQDGLEVCRQLRASSTVPIIFLSSRDEELDRVLGLELGADDYITKPFSPRELVARVKAVLRRVGQVAAAADQKPDPGELVRHGPLEMDLARHRCCWNEQEIILTVTEFALLRTMLERPGRVFDRDTLVDLAYGHGHVITDRTVDSHVRRIRKKLAAVQADPVETVYGIGYRMREELA